MPEQVVREKHEYPDRYGHLFVSTSWVGRPLHSFALLRVT
ncbi:hypothetical protein MITS9509_02731 [Synechococcus sp. MIT S9509]|nr:hypothetical protein MITS9504_02085 [Synechococcus sp. MIT S9504]KZR90442.1 hypothetical protein MITS9509_02731 [Synechococcus sp. MIT S9509]